jgi:hypothetical protein
MGAFDGYWVNGDTGAGHPVADHALDVLHQPAIYGLTPHDVHKVTGGKTTINPYETDKDSPRGKLIMAAGQKGWVRVRAFKGAYTLQMHGGASSRAKRAIPFLLKNGMHRNADITISDLATGFHQKYEGANAVHRAIAKGEIPDTISTRGVGREARAMGDKSAADGVPADLPDQQQRQILRQRLLQRAGMPERRRAAAKVLAEGASAPVPSRP